MVSDAEIRAAVADMLPSGVDVAATASVLSHAPQPIQPAGRGRSVRWQDNAVSAMDVAAAVMPGASRPHQEASSAPRRPRRRAWQIGIRTRPVSCVTTTGAASAPSVVTRLWDAASRPGVEALTNSALKQECDAAGWAHGSVDADIAALSPTGQSGAVGGHSDRGENQQARPVAGLSLFLSPANRLR